MTSDLQLALAQLNDPEQYVQLPDRIVFDAHEDLDDKGQVVQRFDRASLEEICRRSNARDAQGNFCPLTLGHTIPRAKETDQPEPVGYARNFRVRWDPDLQRFVITATYYIKRDRLREAQTYPRTSVELWPSDKVFDPIALLRRTPQRDLKSWTFGVPDGATAAMRYTRVGRGVSLYFQRSSRPVIRYAMEDPTLDQAPVQPAAPPAQPMAPGPEHVEQFMKHVFSHPVARHYAKCYAADEAPEGPDPTQPPVAGTQPCPPMQKYEAGAASGTNTFLPGEKKEEEAERMHKESDAIRYARLERQLQEQGEQLKRYQAERELAVVEKTLTQLEAEGCIFDRAYEAALMVPMNADQRKAHAVRLKQYSKKDPTAYRPSYTIEDSPMPSGQPKRFGKEEMDEAIRMAATKEAPNYEAAVQIIKSRNN